MAATASHQPKKIWIDTDIIFNKMRKEVDDGLALMMAFDHGIEIEGISLIHNVDNGYKVTKKLQSFYQKNPCPVYKGSDDAARGPGEETEAVTAMAEALKRDELTILAIGPATNIANLLEFYPEVAGQIQEIVFCAGRRPHAEFRPENCRALLPDYNFEMDPASFKRVLESNIPITLAGYEASSSIYLYKSDLKQLKHNGREGDHWVYKKLRNWLWYWRLVLNVTGFIPFDTCTLGHLLYPDYFEYDRDISYRFDKRQDDAYDANEGDLKEYFELSYDYDSPRTIDFVYATKPDYKEKIMQHLLGKSNLKNREL